MLGSLPSAVDDALDALYEPNAVFNQFLGSASIDFFSLFFSLLSFLSCLFLLFLVLSFLSFSFSFFFSLSSLLFPFLYLLFSLFLFSI